MNKSTQVEREVTFTVPYLTPPSGNHYKKPTKYIGRDGSLHLGFKLTKETKAYYEATAIFARGATVAPDTDAERRKVRYEVRIDVYLGPKMRGDEDNFLKAGVDALVRAGVIHSDHCSHNIINVHRDDRDNPRTEYRVERLEPQ
jgi:Holliday junction resolvase RusA-like endonuclease